jgi:hypothetical protein
MKKFIYTLLMCALFASCGRKDVIPPTPTEKTFTLKVSYTSGGTISPSGSLPVKVGSDQNLTITAESGHMLASLIADNIDQSTVLSKGNVFTFRGAGIGANTTHAVYAEFVIAHLVSIIAGSNGSAAPSDTIVRDKGSVKFRFTPNPGFHTDSLWLEEGKPGISLDGDVEYSASNIGADIKAKVSFDSGVTKKSIDTLQTTLGLVKWSDRYDSSRINAEHVEFPWNSQPINFHQVGSYFTYHRTSLYTGIYEEHAGPNPYAGTAPGALTTKAVYTIQKDGKHIHLVFSLGGPPKGESTLEIISKISDHDKLVYLIPDKDPDPSVVWKFVAYPL